MLFNRFIVKAELQDIQLIVSQKNVDATTESII